MQYKQYGKTGIWVSRVGYGAMRLPMLKGKKEWKDVDFEKSTKCLLTAFENGINIVDTTHFYHTGNSEVAIGKALKLWKGQKIYLQTKTQWYLDKTEKEFWKLLETAIEKTGVCPIDFFLHHSMSLDMFKKKGKQFVKFSDRAMKKGLIKFRGCSVHDSPENIKKIIDTKEFSVMLMSYNLLNPILQDTIAYASEKGIGVSIMNPVGGGILSHDSPKTKGLLPGAKTSAEACVRYVLATPGVVAAMSGMNTILQVKENAEIASRLVPMTQQEWKGMNVKLAERKKESEKFCTACGYCMPCPHGVDIPGNFRLMNETRFFGLLDYGKKGFAGMRKARDPNDKTKTIDKSALACRECGKCLKKCPHKIPIIEQLVQVAEKLG